jgi:ssDNA-binding Zn-finger/Zn-ribbon topoisomerase 1
MSEKPWVPMQRADNHPHFIRNPDLEEINAQAGIQPSDEVWMNDLYQGCTPLHGQRGRNRAPERRRSDPHFGPPTRSAPGRGLAAHAADQERANRRRSLGDGDLPARGPACRFFERVPPLGPAGRRRHSVRLLGRSCHQRRAGREVQRGARREIQRSATPLATRPDHRAQLSHAADRPGDGEADDPDRAREEAWLVHADDDFDVYGICREPECHFLWLKEPEEPVTCPSCGTPGWPDDARRGGEATRCQQGGSPAKATNARVAGQGRSPTRSARTTSRG